MNHTAYDRASEDMKKYLKSAYSSAYGGNFELALGIGDLFVSNLSIFICLIFFITFWLIIIAN